MDYEKAYKEALERARQFSEKPYLEDSKCIVDYIFPELKESEDEKMLNQLHSWMKEFGGADEYTEKVYLWLKGLIEKQGEQKSAWSEEDEKMLSDIIKDLVHPWNEYIPDRIEDEIKWLKNKLKSLRHQSQFKPSEEMLEALYRVIPENVMEISEDEMLLDKLYQGLKYGIELK